MTNKITKAVIPVAGLGTRMLPATKALFQKWQGPHYATHCWEMNFRPRKNSRGPFPENENKNQVQYSNFNTATTDRDEIGTLEKEAEAQVALALWWGEKKKERKTFFSKWTTL